MQTKLSLGNQRKINVMGDGSGLSRVVTQWNLSWAGLGIDPPRSYWESTMIKSDLTADEFYSGCWGTIQDGCRSTPAGRRSWIETWALMGSIWYPLESDSQNCLAWTGHNKNRVIGPIVMVLRMYLEWYKLTETSKLHCNSLRVGHRNRSSSNTSVAIENRLQTLWKWSSGV